MGICNYLGRVPIYSLDITKGSTHVQTQSDSNATELQAL